MLQSCVELFAAEMVTKGLAPMVRGRDFDALARLYRYCADVAQLPRAAPWVGRLRRGGRAAAASRVADAAGVLSDPPRARNRAVFRGARGGA